MANAEMSLELIEKFIHVNREGADRFPESGAALRWQEREAWRNGILPLL